MKIALNATVFRNPLSGVGKRVVALVCHSARLRPDIEWHFLAPYKVKRPDLPGVRATWHEGRGGLEVWWRHRVVPGLLAQLKADVYEAPWGGGLPMGPGPCPYVTTFHDTLPLDRGEWFGARLRYRLRAAADIRRAHRVIAVSAFTKARLEKHFPQAVGKIKVIPNGVGAGMAPSAPEALDRFLKACLAPLGLNNFVLYLGGYNPRKNIENLVRSFAALSGSRPELPGDLSLVLSGHPNAYFQKKIAPLIQKLNLVGRVCIPGYLNEEDLPLWYGAARAVVYPSLHEGFGMPVLEAMACGAPVLIHKEGPMGEFSKGVALEVDGHRVADMAKGLGILVGGQWPGNALKQEGISRAQNFRWETLAAQYLNVLSETSGGS